jgi:hypothetical protein
MYMEPAILTRIAKAETPLQANITHNLPTRHRKPAAAPPNRLGVLKGPNANHTSLPSKKRDPFFTSFPGKELVPVPVEHEETLSEAEVEKLLYVRPPHIITLRPLICEGASDRFLCRNKCT